MKFFKYGLLAFGLIGLTLLAQPAQAETDQQKALSAGAVKILAAEINKLYLGRVVSGKTRKGYAYKTPIKADGSIEANKRRGAGKFLVIEDQACMQFKGLWDDKPMCWSLYRVSKDKYQTFRKDGSLSADVEFLPLN
ncbi:MAG: hypothetical protein OQK35_05090 [Alphaproteobacteria bacterium]|nr:hypothetical protein [Rhodospirillales bacterium]MCW9045688.1 hypothetical protein [Alphaproteobacteria bacterium]